MQPSYQLRSDTIHNEESEIFTVYGIEAHDQFGKLLRVIPNIFCEKQRAERFVSLCNSEKLQLIHLDDVIEDALAESYEDVE